MELDGRQIKDGTVDTAQLAGDAVTSAKIPDDALDSEHYAAGSIDGEHLSSDAKTTVLNAKKLIAFNQPGVTVTLAAASTTTGNSVTKALIDAATVKAIGGSGSKLGLVTSGSNKVLLRDKVTNDPIEDSSNRQIYARQTGSVTALTGTLSFSNSSTTVTGTSTLFSSELSAGDFIRLDADDRWVEVSSITSDTELELTSAYSYTGGSGSGAKVDLTLEHYVDVDGTETAHTFGSTQDVELLSPEMYDLDTLPAGALTNAPSFGEVLPADHTHDGRYYTESEIGAVGSGNPNTGSGAALVGTDASAIGSFAGSTDHVQAVLEAFHDKLSSLDSASGTPQDQRTSGVTITGTDSVLMTLSPVPKSADSVRLYQNGLEQDRGSGKDYTVNTSNGEITLLASSGTALDSISDDIWHASYES